MYMQPPGAVRNTVLIVDDDVEARRQLRNLLSANGYWVIEAGNGRIARELLAVQEINLVVSDIFMPECDGFELIAAIRAMASPVPVIAMSDHECWTGLNFLDAANDLGAAAVIEKPFRAHLLLRLIDDALLAAAHRGPVVPLGAVAEPERKRIPAGLEWVGGRPA
ncbi:PleD family two-component system response regulator [Dongia sp.]|uniref:response regulator n=1 Tax=Dongia sp. TaxID=1977262 RepID=UPI003750FB47